MVRLARAGRKRTVGDAGPWHPWHPWHPMACRERRSCLSSGEVILSRLAAALFNSLLARAYAANVRLPLAACLFGSRSLEVRPECCSSCCTTATRNSLVAEASPRRASALRADVGRGERWRLAVAGGVRNIASECGCWCGAGAHVQRRHVFHVLGEARHGRTRASSGARRVQAHGRAG